MTLSKNSASFMRNRYNQIICIAAFIFSLVNIIMIINSQIPSEVFNKEGYSRWIFYYHVPIAWNWMVALFLGGINSTLYLVTGKRKYDLRALAFSELSTLFGFLVLFSGFIWAAPAWGTNWRWEPRLTTTLILELIYLGYFMIKAYGGPYEKTSIYRAYISIMSVAMVPVVYYSVTFLDAAVQAHPGQGEYLNYGGLSIFLFSLISFMVLLACLFSIRIFRLKNNISNIQKNEVA